MSIDWLYDEPIIGNIEFPHIWTKSGVLISISSLTTPSWRKMGYLKIEPLIDGEFFTAQYKSIEFGNSLITIPFNTYRLSFEPVNNLLILHPNISIKIKEFSLNMYVNPGEYIPRETGEPTYTTITPALPTAAQPVFTIAPVRDRRSILITNRTNKPMYIKEGAAETAPTLVAADPFTLIPVGGSYSLEDYSGEIVGIMTAAFTASGRVIVKELPYL
jgi:hypothetical protein